MRHVSTTETPPRTPRISAVLREDERVTPLELFFDLVFVLAITQCTALMASDPTWRGLARGVLVLGLLWWSWVGYAWLTSVVDPEEGAVRIAIFVAMAALLVTALCVPTTFAEDDTATIFAVAYGLVRWGQVALIWLGARDDPNMRHSVSTLAGSTTVGVAIVLAGSFVSNATVQLAIWALALFIDMAGPYFFGAAGWRLVPGHFAERHGLIVLIALGESIVAIGVGAQAGIDAGVIGAAILGTALAAAIWWLYFDVVAIVAARRLANAEPGRPQNTMARDSYSYLHFPMVAGIVLIALGMKKTLAHVEEHLHTVPAAALLGGTALYLLAHVAFRYRHVRTLNTRRLGLATVLVALIPAATALPALATLAVVTALLIGLIVYETRSYGPARERVRHQLARERTPD
jgi:low temperature requirement protein LtrA